MNLKEYLEFTDSTAIYPRAGTGTLDELSYLSMGLGGEAGEILEFTKKLYRDNTKICYSDRVVDFLTEEQRTKILGELGDITWYWVRLCAFYGLDPEFVLEYNRTKLTSRKDRGVLGGSGDLR